MTYTRKEIIRMVARKTGYTIQDIDNVVFTLFDVVRENALNGNSSNLGYVVIGGKVSGGGSHISVNDGKLCIRKPTLKPYCKFGYGIRKYFKELENN